MQSKRNKRIRNSDTYILWMMAIPCIVMLIMFCYVPLYGWAYAFVKFKPGKALSQCEFVGLKYFRDILSSSEIWPVLRNTLIFSFLNLATSPLAVVFAIVLSEFRSTKFQKLIQTTTTFPNFVSWIIVYSLSMMVFSVDDGILNKILFSLGWIDTPTNVLVDKGAVYLLHTGLSLWKGLGYGAIVYFAAIAGIDTELYDAAAVDGAGRFQTILHIKVPGVAPTFIVLLLLSIGSILNSGFDHFYVFYNALVHERIQTLDLYVYRIGMQNGKYSLSTAVGIFRTLVSTILLVSANLLAKKVNGRSVL